MSSQDGTTVDLCITKDDGKSIAIPGMYNIYTITITNNGPGTIDSLFLSDVNPLFKDIKFQHESKGNFDQCTGEWKELDLGCGDTVCIEVKGFIPADAECGELTNVVKVTVPECYVNVGENTACDTDKLIPTVDLCVTKDDGKCIAIPGTENIYTITITNNGPSEIDSVRLTDCNSILQNICFQNPSQGCFDPKTGDWTGLNLGCGDTICIEVKGYIPADAECGELTNVINVCVPECVVNNGDSSARDTDYLVPSVDLCVTKDDGKCEAIPGTENVYKITITNNGPSEIDSVRLTDCNPLFQDVCFQNASKGSFNQATGNWTGLELGCGDTVCIEVKGYIPADVECGELTNVIKVCVPECVVNTGQDSASDTDKLVPTVDLCITKDDCKSEAVPGTDNVYLITITNNGPSEISSLHLSDENALLQNIHFKCASEGSFDQCSGEWTGLTLGCGETITIEVVGTIDPTAGCGELTNVINVCVPECVVNTGQDSACDTDKLVPTVDLCITKDDCKSEVIPGADNIYTITITNNGPSEISSLQLSDVNPLLQDITFQNASQGSFDCATGEWTGLSLGNGDEVTIEVKGYIPLDTECGELTNVINVCVPECVVNTGESSAFDTDKIVKPDCNHNQGSQCPPNDNNDQGNQCGPDDNNNLGNHCPLGNNQNQPECVVVGNSYNDGTPQSNDSDCINLGACPPVNSLGLNEVIDNTANGSDGDKCKTNLTTLLDNICQSNNKSSNNCQPVGNGNVGNENHPNGEGDLSNCGQPNSTFTHSANNELRSFEFSATNTSNSASSGD